MVAEIQRFRIIVKLRPVIVDRLAITLEHNSDTPATRSRFCLKCKGEAPHHLIGCPESVDRN